jgi:class 3 adenylate cyclase
MLDLFLLQAATVGILLALYRLEMARRRIFERDLVIAGKSRELETEKTKTEALLANVLPASVASQLLARPGSMADEIQKTTVLFADLVGFTPLAARLSAAEVVRHLNEIFLRFDALAERHGIEKVKTIGDAYMAVGGVPVPQDDHAARSVRLGLDMIAATREYAAQSGLPLALRVGIHSGPVVAGVIGRTRLSYDLWGDTVNVASRMEQHGLPDAVQVSESTWSLVADSFAGRPRGDVELRGRGEFRAWIVTATRDVTAEAAA